MKSSKLSEFDRKLRRDRILRKRHLMNQRLSSFNPKKSKGYPFSSTRQHTRYARQAGI